MAGCHPEAPSSPYRATETQLNYWQTNPIDLALIDMTWYHTFALRGRETHLEACGPIKPPSTTSTIASEQGIILLENLWIPFVERALVSLPVDLDSAKAIIEQAKSKPFFPRFFFFFSLFLKDFSILQLNCRKELRHSWLSCGISST
jgi:hypothetical protein